MSDREAKHEVLSVDEQQVLKEVAAMPLSSWAQLDPVDVHGETLASIKALHQAMSAQRERLERLEAEGDRTALAQVATLPISSWSYTFDPREVRHLGPMAQDVHAAFGLPGDERTYDPADAHRVSLSSIRALFSLQAEQARRLDQLEAENRTLRARLSSATCAP